MEEDHEPKIKRMMPIEPFDAEDCDDRRVRVLGIAYRDGELAWVVAKEVEGGEVFPELENSVWRTYSVAALARRQQTITI